MPLFSIISVSYNNKDGLRKTLKSLERQRCRDFEVIIVDGGSSDGTQDFIRDVMTPQIRFISEKDKGIYDAQNKGIGFASGEYLLFLNAGDSFENEHVLGKIKDSSDNAEDILYGDILMIDRKKDRYYIKYPDQIFYRYWYREKYLCHQAVFFHKRVFQKHGVYDLKYRFAADFDLLQRVWFLPETTKKRVDTVVVIYDLEGVSAKKENEIIIFREYRAIRKEHHPLPVFLFYSLFYDTKLFEIIRYYSVRIFFLITKPFVIFSYLLKRVLIRSDKKLYKSIIIDKRKKPFVLHLSTSDQSGGAAKAAFHIHQSLLEAGQNSLMLVSKKATKDDHVILAKESTGFGFLIDLIVHFKRNRSYKRAVFKKEVMHSFQNYSFLDIKLILQVLKPDIVHLHWIGNNFISIEALQEIQMPIVWTMHDMWPFLGAEHVCFDESYKTGYSSDNVNHTVWERKKEAYSKLDIHPVGVSRWISDIAKESLLFSKYPTNVIPNIIRTEIFFPRDSDSSREFWRFRSSETLLLFGSDYRDGNKGYFVIENLIKKYEEEKRKDITFIVFGSIPIELKTEFVNVINIGYVKSSEELAILYSSVDITLVPSKIESFCLTAAESISCGTPVVCFDTSGLKDIVMDGETGYKAECFSQSSFEENLDKTIIASKRDGLFKKERLHDFIKERFGASVASGKYLELYDSVLKNKGVSV
ncbi:hypothetical protein LPTSP3_g21160 [Leptospira kobayashii]|uniref:Glycosyltransferase n=1 Tax=Leptospira kobayashii TaxID=1917830 RepID=A0ABN6KGQ8_9LEPT|nr:glycosyltransferase [Leptospira kobayashii]BDA79186.1 hypothetical protein LPTSP3_g21160 [Leptospira kobayashii]